MITKTDCIIFRTVDYSESSIIATVMSREHGKISLIVKGARKPKSAFAGLVQPGKILRVVYYFKSTRSVQTLTEASYLHRVDQLGRDIEKMAISTRVLELVSQLVHEDEVNEAVFDFLRNFLVWLDVQKESSRSVFPYVQIRLAFLFGLEIQVEEIDERVETAYLNIDAGSVSEDPVSENAIRLSRNQLKFLKNSAISRKVSILNQGLNNHDLRSLTDHLDAYFRYHVEGMKPRRSDAIFDQILKE